MESLVPTNASELRALVDAFLLAAEQASIGITQDSIDFEFHAAPHEQPSILPAGMVAIYWFSLNRTCLKVGQAGAKSSPRYTSQHYNPGSTDSNLAKSILKHREMIASIVPDSQRAAVISLSESTVGTWMKAHLTRCNLLVDKSFGRPALSFLETFVQARLQPLFEGRVIWPLA
ncbi:MAG: hypothetical protein NTW38_10860 [Candidatus Aminicenantes bacterium]|nr:hypothetical protein [Candidatus Aminicenantes bacterium]